MIKEFLSKILLKKERAELELAGKRIEDQFRAFMKSEAEARKNFEEKFSVTDYLAKKIPVFDPELVKNRRVSINPQTGETFVDGNIIDEAKKRGIGEDEFTSSIHTISKNASFKFLIEFLQSGQILTSFYLAKDVQGINFGRASATGHQQVLDEVERIAGIHEAKKTPPEDFDRHSML